MLGIRDGFDVAEPAVRGRIPTRTPINQAQLRRTMNTWLPTTISGESRSLRPWPVLWKVARLMRPIGLSMCRVAPVEWKAAKVTRKTILKRALSAA